MWLATQAGISRFDGNSFVNFNNSSDSTFLSNRFINIFKEANGKLYALNDAMQLFEINSFSKLKVVNNKKYGKDFIVLGNKDILFLNPFINLKTEDINNIKDISILYTVNNKDFYKVFERFTLYNDDTISKNALYHFNTRYMFVYKSYFGVISKKNEIVLFKNGVLIKQYRLEKLLNSRIDINKFFINQFENYITFNLNENVYLFNFNDSVMKVDLMPFNANLYHDYTYVKYDNNVFYYSQKNGLFKVMKSYFDCYSDSTFETRDIYRVAYLNNSLVLKSDVFSLSYHFAKNKKSAVFNTHKDTICVLLNDSVYYVSNKSIKKHKLEVVNPFNKSFKFNEFTDYYQFKSQFYVISNDNVFLFKNRKVLELFFSYPNKTLKTICKLEAENGWLLGVKNEGLIYFNSIYNKTYKLNFFNNKDIRMIQYDFDLGFYWVFTYGSGIYILTKDLRVKKFFTDENNYMRFSHYFLKDNLNFYWIPTNNGLFRFKQKNIEANLKRENNKISYQYFNKYSGIINNEFNGRFVNSGVVLPNGNFAFSSMEGVVVVNPYQLENFNNNHPIIIDLVELNSRKLEIVNKYEILEGYDKFKIQVSSAAFVNSSPFALEYLIPEVFNEWQPIINNSIELLSLSRGNYMIYVRRKGDLNSKNYKLIQLNVYPPWYFSNISMFLYSLIFVLMGFIFSKKIYKSKQMKIKNEIKLLESELKALRAQINPHYLSNSLMSLQSVVLDNDKEKAFEFIGQYGKVMRSILEKSDYSFISLDQEIETLKEYIKLEGLIRNLSIDFDYRFYSDITFATITNVKVPTMIFQPFVENAIIHGLVQQKQKLKRIQFDITLKDKKLNVIITDNGVGYQRKESERKSYGLENIQNRLKAYSKLLKIDSFFRIENTGNGSDTESGTRVTINMPYLIEPENKN